MFLRRRLVWAFFVCHCPSSPFPNFKPHSPHTGPLTAQLLLTPSAVFTDHTFPTFCPYTLLRHGSPGYVTKTKSGALNHSLAVAESHSRSRTRFHCGATTVFMVTTSLYFPRACRRNHFFPQCLAENRLPPRLSSDFGTRSRSLPRQAGPGESSLTSIRVVIAFMFGTLLIIAVFTVTLALDRPPQPWHPTRRRSRFHPHSPHGSMSANRPSLRRL